MMTTTETNLEVAKTIAAQIGGRAFFMMGTQFKTGDANSLSFNVRGSKKINRVKITLDAGSDTYVVEMCKVRAMNVTNRVTVCGVYADGLHQVIEIETGLRLSL